MADYLKMLTPKQMFDVSANFDYIEATKNFKGTQLFPLMKSDNFKVSLAMLPETAQIPVMAQVHAFDVEARIGDRPNYETTEVEMLYIKEKLDQGERLRKLIKEKGMEGTEGNILDVIYADFRNLISRVLTRTEVMICEMMGTGKITINENNVNKEVVYVNDPSNLIDVKGWANVAHGIIKDIQAIQSNARNKIVRMVTSTKVLNYMLANTEIAGKATLTGAIVTKKWLQEVIFPQLGMDLVIIDETYKKSALAAEEFRFFPEDRICFLKTTGAVGATLTTTSPLDDANVTVGKFKGHVGLQQWPTPDPVTTWSLAGAVVLPVPLSTNSMVICTVKD